MKKWGIERFHNLPELFQLMQEIQVFVFRMLLISLSPCVVLVDFPFKIQQICTSYLGYLGYLL